MPRTLFGRAAILTLLILAPWPVTVTTRAPSSSREKADAVREVAREPGKPPVAAMPQVARQTVTRALHATRGPQPASPGDVEVETSGRGSYADLVHRQSKAAEVWRRELAALDMLEEFAPPASPPVPPGGPELAPDSRANDRNPVTCAGCQNRPIIQTEAAVAVLGSHVVAGWNEGEVSCQTNTRENYGWSTDGGQTFTDGQGLFPIPTSVIGDAIVQVNQNTGRFYIAGIGNGSATTRGIGVIRGSFGPGGFATDVRALASSGTTDLHDKPWMCVDSLSGNVYVSWTRFEAVIPRIEFQARDADLNPVGPVLTLSDTTTGCGGQWSQIVTGPQGEVWVMWLDYPCPSPYVTIQMRRSDDHGLTFGPIVNVHRYAPNNFHGCLGFLRPFAATPLTLAVDRSNGPRRGRLYVSFDAPLEYRDDVIPITTATFESEPNNSAATANPMSLAGGRLRGVKSGAESDWFRLDLQAGETFFMETIYSPAYDFDSTRAGLMGRIWCPTESGLVEAFRSTLTSNGLLYTARQTQSYYLEMFGSASDTASYVFTTASIPVMPADVGLDARDQVLLWSDDGVSWGTPVRLNDSPPGVDGQYATVGVDGRGRVHAFWMEFAENACGTASNQYMRSSGNGGISWGPVRRITDAPSTWAGPFCSQLNGNTQGDYQSIATDGDIVAAAFNDARQGDPDIYLDVANHSVVPVCAPLASAPAGVDTLVDFSITNAGNYVRTLAWRVEDTRGWITSVSPAASGSTDVPIGAPLQLQAMVRPASCAGESSIVRWITSDPWMPGYEDTCVTVLRCRDLPTPVLASVVLAHAAFDRVALRWSVADRAWVAAGVWRRTQDTGWTLLGAPDAAGAEWSYEDRAVAAGARYAYRLELRLGADAEWAGETWVSVPAAARFEIAGIAPNPVSRELEIAFSLEAAEPARLEVFDVAGRSVHAREVGDLGPGSHRLRIPAGRDWPAGIYTVRLVQGARQASVRAAVVR